MTRLIRLAAIVTILALGLAAGTVAAARPAKAKLVTVSLQLKWVAQSQFAGYFVANDLGYYRKVGLKVNILNGGPQITPETVVESGKAQFGIDWMASLLHERDNGRKIVNIAQIWQETGMRMIAFKSSGISSIKKFKGHTIGVWPSGNQYQFFALMHKLHYNCSVNTFSCASSTGIKVVQEGFTMDPFLNHQLDVSQAMTYNELGVVTEPPPSGHGVPKNKLYIFNYNKYGVSMLEDGIFAQPGWLKKHKSIAVKFLKASVEGWTYVVKHPTKAGELTFKHIPAGTATKGHMIYQAKQVAKLISAGLKGHPVGWMNPTAYNRTWQEAKQDGVITKTPKGAYDQSYWKAATKGMKAP
ncbi:MAG TPA: ABC transporter substrate-binding protein [Chloroflexota bacterium]|nr:ABC transporter substrate-binding protein [Chloroflexota bacterium]